MTSIGVGDKVGRLTIIANVAPLVQQGKTRKFSRSQWLCRCDCGTEKIIRRDSIRRGFSQSCGCLQRDACTKHGHYVGDVATTTYKSWASMRRRCLTPSDEHYPEYGGRGIEICGRWSLFENFLADMGERPLGMTLDRIDVNGDYKSSNCRWASSTQQGRNRRNTVFVVYKGEKVPLVEVCEKLGKPYDYAVRRLKINKKPAWMAELCVSE